MWQRQREAEEDGEPRARPVVRDGGELDRVRWGRPRDTEALRVRGWIAVGQQEQVGTGLAAVVKAIPLQATDAFRCAALHERVEPDQQRAQCDQAAGLEAVGGRAAGERPARTAAERAREDQRGDRQDESKARLPAVLRRRWVDVEVDLVAVFAEES